MEQRTGKTPLLLHDYFSAQSRDEVDDLLVIAPGGAYRTWLTAIDEHVPPDVLKSTKVLLWSARSTKRSEIEQLLSYRGRRILIINSEAMSNVDRARELVIEFLAQRRVMVAADESTFLKNPRAKRARFLVEVVGPRASHRRILSGLPTPRSPLDIFMQFAFLDPTIIGIRRYSQFQARYAVTKQLPIPGKFVRIVVGYKNLADLSKRIEPYCYRVLLRDCTELPESTYVRREVQMTKEQTLAYASMKKHSFAQLSEAVHVTATAVVTQMLRLHQILMGHVVDEEGVRREIPTNRVDALLETLEEVTGKVVVWCSYDDDIRRVTAALEKEYGEGSVARFWGGNNATREDEEKLFKTDDRCRFMVGTPAAGRFGRTWDVADTVIYYSSTPDLEHRKQSEDRVKRVGKTRPILYIDLIVPGTVEGKFLRALRDKQNLSDIITGDDYSEWLE
jgi:SNF2 family DNA or RNA helicase